MNNLRLIDIVNYFSKNKIIINNNNENNYIIKSFPRVLIDYPADFNNLLICLLIGDRNINYTINSFNNRISINNDILFNEKKKLLKNITDDFNIDLARKKKIINQINNNLFSNDIAIMLSDYFLVNLIIYNNDNNLVKLYYIQNELDPNLPFIIINYIKDSNSTNHGYELIKNENKYYFEYKHPLIIDLLKSPICIGINSDKKFKVQNIIDYTDINELSIIKEEKFLTSVNDIKYSTTVFIDLLLENYP